jgi:putative ATP-binding cassette transporter
MKLFRFLQKHSRGVMTFAILTGIVSGVSSAGLVALINLLLVQGASSTPSLLAGFIGLCILVPIARIASELVLIRLGQNTVLDLQMRLSGQLLAAPLRQLEQIGTPRILSTLTDDIPAITAAVSMIPVLCINVAVLLGALAYLGWLSWQLLVAVLVGLVIGILSYQLPIARALGRLAQAREVNDDLYGHFRSLTDGAKELKLHRPRREEFLGSELLGTARNLRARTIEGLSIYSIASTWGQLLVFVVIGALLFLGPRWLPVSAAALTGFALTLLYLMTPLQVAMNAVPVLGRAEVAIVRIDRLGLELRREEALAEAPAAAGTPPWTSLDLVGVTHAYRREGEEGEFLLGPIDLSLHPGEVVFIAGGNGSGKTTLAKLLSGLYTPDHGEIRLDGCPVCETSRDDYRQYFSAVFSDFFLFRGLLGLRGADLDRRAEEMLRELQLEHRVTVREGRFSDIELSQGQRKRLALLSAWLEDRPIYLFDEWAADQDPLFKEIFYRRLLPRLKASGKTVLVISHDERYYHLADRLIRLEEGKVIGDTRPADRLSGLPVMGGMAGEEL